MKITKRFILTGCLLVCATMETTARAQIPFPLMPSVAADPDGMLHSVSARFLSQR
jgi:hypothetical protein